MIREMVLDKSHRKKVSNDFTVQRSIVDTIFELVISRARSSYTSSYDNTVLKVLETARETCSCDLDYDFSSRTSKWKVHPSFDSKATRRTNTGVGFIEYSRLPFFRPSSSSSSRSP